LQDKRDWTQINAEVKGKEKEKEDSPLPACLLGGDKRGQAPGKRNLKK